MSGINLGANLGDDVIYSGTVAAALEGRHLEMSPIAISLVSHDKLSMSKAAIESSKIIQEIICKEEISKKTLLNINIPDYESENLSFEFTRLGKRGIPLPASNIKGDFYKIGAAGPPEDDSEGTDFYCINKNKISITPLTYDLTNIEILKKLKIR